MLSMPSKQIRKVVKYFIIASTQAHKAPEHKSTRSTRVRSTLNTRARQARQARQARKLVSTQAR